MISIENLSVSYGKQPILKGINLMIERGVSCAIIGTSGCGKTTLLYTLAGLLKQTSGEILINGIPVGQLSKKPSLILQDLGLFPWKTIEQNVSLGLKRVTKSKQEKQNRINCVLNALEIIEFRDKYPHELSGGQKQRCAIARALVSQPSVFLLDEATSALDAMTKEKIQDVLLNLHQEHQNTMLFVTHSIEEAVFLGEKIIVMEAGVIKTIIHNEYFGSRDIRHTHAYFELCHTVRSYLYE